MTSSTGCSGLTRSGLPPSAMIASRIAARSTTQGTPVKSCSRTRAGMKEISFSERGGGVPLRERADVVGLDERVVLAPQQVLEQDLHRVRQPRDAGEPGLLERGKAVDLHRLSAAADLGACTETVQCGGHSPRSYSADRRRCDPGRACRCDADGKSAARWTGYVGARWTGVSVRARTGSRCDALTRSRCEADGTSVRGGQTCHVRGGRGVGARWTGVSVRRGREVGATIDEESVRSGRFSRCEVDGLSVRSRM